MLKKVSDRIAQSLGEQLQVHDEQVEVFSYGLQVVIGAMLKLIVIISLSLILGIFNEVMIYLIFFILLRKYGGGVHLSTYSRCLIIGTAMILSFSKLATINISVHMLLILVATVFFWGCFCTVKWVPAGTEKKAVENKKCRQKQKIKVIITLFAWLTSLVLLIHNELVYYSFAATLGVASSFYLISPLGYRSINSLEKALNKLERRCKVCLKD